MKIIELKESFTPGLSEIRCYADGKRISRGEFMQLEAQSVQTDCLYTQNTGGVRHNFKTVRIP